MLYNSQDLLWRKKLEEQGDLQHAIELQNRRIVDLQLRVFREQGLILAALLGLSAFFSMAETSITTLSPWKVRELAEKEDENGVFKLLHLVIFLILSKGIIVKGFSRMIWKKLSSTSGLSFDHHHLPPWKGGCGGPVLPENGCPRPTRRKIPKQTRKRAVARGKEKGAVDPILAALLYKDDMKQEDLPV
ncbi:hypothetical protein LXL04_034170 [Taraxacum kok-saghyz]